MRPNSRSKTCHSTTVTASYSKEPTSAMEARREPQEEHSMFETTHVLGNFMASSPLLAQAWRQCAVGNAGSASFVVERIDDVSYVSFSGVQAVLSSMANIAGSGFFSLVPIDSGGNGIFSSLVGDEEGGEPVLVHAASLHLFFSIYNTPEFQMMLKETQNRAVIFTGHSIGGTIASLATICFLCRSRSTCSTSTSTLCITFGSPLLGNGSLSRFILQERWGGKFCHVVSRSDIVPRLLFCPPDSLSPQLIVHLLQSWQFSFRFPQLSNEQKSELYLFISMHIAVAATEQKLQVSDHQRSSYRPFGSYLLCSTEGAVCIDNPLVIIRMLYLTFIAGSFNLSIEEHLSYEDIVERIPQLLLRRGSVLQQEVPGSSYGAGISLALEASGIRIQDSRAMEAQECLKMAKKMGLSPNLNCAGLAIRLAKVTPCRAQIEWYKVCCDEDMGYYDSFKHRRASKRDSKVNMNRIKLAQFWDDLVNMLQNNELPHDFQKRNKWVNAAQFYMLLVEPLDIAEYYRTQKHKSKGHYQNHGRERRYEVFDRWWRDMKKDSLEGVHNGNVWKRSKLAGLTQDSCFWARVEEAREWSENARSEMDHENLVRLSIKLNAFDCYAKELIERKEVSKDVLLPRSSYSLWVEEWMKLKSELGLQIP